MTDASASVDVSRILFGFATEFHYLFVPLTIGLMAAIALLEGMALLSRKQVWEEAALYWGRFFVLNFVCGALTGWPLRHHLQAQWTRYADAAAEVFSHVFALEGRLAPVLFGLVLVFTLRRRLPLPLRLATSVTLACALIAQSLAILALNAWMQNPTGITLIDGHWRLTDPAALFDNPLLPIKVLHTLGAAYVLGGMFVVGLSAWLLLRGRRTALAQASLHAASAFTLLALLVTGLAGHRSGELAARYQPAKFAAIEALWRPSAGPAALTLLAWPDAQTRSNLFALEVPEALGWIAGDGEHPLPNLQDIERQTREALQRALALPEAARHPARMSVADYQARLGALSLLDTDTPTESELAAAARAALPPVAPVFWGFRLMVGGWALLMAVVGLMTWRGADPQRRTGRLLLWACVLALPWAWVANAAGWVVCEVGRQPWTIAGLLSTAQSHGGVGAAFTALTLLGSGIVYAGMLFGNVLLSLAWLRDKDSLAQPQPETAAAPLSHEAPVLARALPAWARRHGAPTTTHSQFSGSDKRRIVAAARQPGASLAHIAREHQISVRRLQHWIDILERAGRLPQTGNA